MKRCLQLAKNGFGSTYPNPLVGCAIVHDDIIIGEGWHQKAGQAHAEVNAINSVKNSELLQKATLYVSLEPCSHYGKTPPCSDLIIEKKIPRVVIGTVDPNPKVAGKGIAKLVDAGVEIVVGCLESECNNLNKRFFTAQRQKRPYVILKWAQTQDGFIAPEQQKAGEPTWITNPYSLQLVHQWRSQEQAILVGKNTALKDNPQLNTRLWKGKNPTRVLIDRNLTCLHKNSALHLFDQQIKTLVFCEHPQKNKEHLIFESIDFNRETVSQILSVLHKHNLQSVIVEGGNNTLQHFITAGLWDEARVFIGAKYFYNGIKAPKLPLNPVATHGIANDTLNIYYHD